MIHMSEVYEKKTNYVSSELDVETPLNFIYF